MSKKEKKTIGFAGWPDESVLREYGNAELVDLDNEYPGVPMAGADILPQNTCAVIKRIVANGMAMSLDAIIIDDGPGKCDMARMVAHVLDDRTGVPVIRARNDNRKGRGTPISDSTLPPGEKAVRILDGLTGYVEMGDIVHEPNPPAAVWGVPAADLSLYDLFPKGAGLLGWFRCLENRTPALEEMELDVIPGVPTVFFAQTFCHKNIIARQLANKYNGLYIDADGVVTASVRAKVEAFLRFNAGIKGE